MKAWWTYLCADSNQIVQWLRRIEGLRSAAGFLIMRIASL
jgi:hypothetical protein